LSDEVSFNKRDGRRLHSHEDTTVRLTFRRQIRSASIIVALLFSCSIAQAAPPPSGSYQQTCRNVQASENTLTAFCQTRRGNAIGTRLEGYRQCYGDIYNDDGRLMCRQSEGDLTLYEKSDYRGRSLPVNNDMPRLPGWFGDLTSSIRVRRGTWEVCANPNYRGRCEVIRRDVHDLDTMRFSNKISSVRRVSDRDRGRDEGEDNDRDRGRSDNDGNDHGSYDRDGGNDHDRSRRGGDATPSGSYTQTCRDARIDGDMLRAECKDREGRWHQTKIQYESCRGDISNQNGELTCNR
jgi:hypothetical protein